jgi:phage baseplate assembly protein W
MTAGVSFGAFLGAGLGLPLSPNETGRTPRLAGADKVRQAIGVILETEPGERVMLPAFGCGLRQFLMQPNGVGVRARIRREIQAALNAWEPRIAVDEVLVVPDEQEPSLVLIDIAYTHLRDGRRDNLVYPFYLE